MSLSAYLTSKYLTAEPAAATSKKRKRKKNSGLIIADDDALGWSSRTAKSDADADETDSPQTVVSGSADFRKVKTTTWKTVGVSALHKTHAEAAEAAAADHILAQVAAEKSAAQKDEDHPVILDADIVKMGDGTHAGLQTARAVTQQMERRKQEEKAAWQAERKANKAHRVEETVYRDATGRRIDLTLRRQEVLREENARAAKEREKLEALKGDVQRAAMDKRREELDEARFMPLARTIDDEEMNKELREKDRWNDPASQFMPQKRDGSKKLGRPSYNGAAAPNRYGIRPGHKWDGVDRSNGWEGHRFKTLNRTTRNRDLAYSWQMDE